MMLVRRNGVALLGCALFSAAVLSPAAALAADGPGYGGTANQLSVDWVQASTTSPSPTPTDTSAPTTGPTPTASPDNTTSKTTAPAPQKTTSQPAPAPAPTKTVEPAPTKTYAPEPAPQDTTQQQTTAPKATASAAALQLSAPQPNTSAVASISNGLGIAAFNHTALLMAAEQPILSGEAQEFSLSIAGIGFESGAKVKVQIGSTMTRDTNASVVGALNMTVPGVQLTSNEPGQTIVASGLGPSGAPIVLTGSIPPVPRSGGPVAIFSWIVAGVATVWGGVWLWRRFARAGRAGSAERTASAGRLD